eukprot:2592030-Prymnesium_polylepis.1
MKRQLGLTRAFRGKISDRYDISAYTSRVVTVGDSMHSLAVAMAYGLWPMAYGLWPMMRRVA